MPQLKSAAKYLRSSKRRAEENEAIKKRLHKLIKSAKGGKDLPTLYKLIDKAAKRGIFHQNKAARTRSALAKKLGKSRRSAS